MIKEQEVFHAGRFGRPHGTNGTIVLNSDTNAFDDTDCEYLVCAVDGILVPFFIDEYEIQNDGTVYVKLEDVESSEAARFFTHREVFLPNAYMSEQTETLNPDFFTGYRAKEVRHGLLGTISAIDDTTANVLFIVEREDGELLIPAVEEFIKKVDHKKREILFSLPEGLINI